MIKTLIIININNYYLKRYYYFFVNDNYPNFCCYKKTSEMWTYTEFG